MYEYRITYKTKEGSVYSHIEEYDEEYLIEEGSWQAPFPNENGDSTAFGLVECLVQSDQCPDSFRNEEICFVQVEKI